MPETVAAPPAAPAPSAPSAPAPAASTPAAPAPPTPSTPAAAPAPPTPSSGAPAAPATPAAPTPYNAETSTVPPKPSDYPDTVEGQNQFVEDNGKWSLLHPEEADKLNRPPEAAPAAEAPKTDADQPADAPKPAEPAVAAATPAVIDEWTNKSPELKAAFEAHPELRTAVMEMARQNEAAAPVLAIVSTKEEAEFAVDHANRLVSLQTNWMLSGEDPEMVGPAWDQTVEMFKERDKDGKEILENGKPKLGADFKPFVRKAASTAMEDYSAGAQVQIDAMKARLAGRAPTTEEQDALDKATYEKAAFDFVAERLKQPDGDALPALPANATPEQIAFQKKLEERSREVDAKTGKQTTESRKVATQALDRKIQMHYESGLNKYIDTSIAAMKERGEYLPDFVLNDKWINPQTGKVTGLTSFGVKLYQALNEKIMGNPLHRAKLAQLQTMGASGEDARKAEIDRLQNLYLPKLFQAEVKRIQDGIRGVPQPKSPATVDPTSTNANVPRVEPRSQATPSTPSMSDDQIMTWARTEAAKDPGFSSLTQAQQEETVLAKYSRKKFFGV